MLRTILITAVLTFVSFTATAATMDFDSNACSSNSCFNDGGLSITGSYAHVTMTSTSAINSSGYSIRSAYSSYIDIDSATGGSFSLFSVDLGEYSTLQEGRRESITFIGIKLNGTEVSQTFQIDGLMNGSNDFQNFLFSSDFTRLQSAHIERTYNEGFSGYITPLFSMDNLQYSVVPVPGAVWLLGSGLMALFAWRRRC
jgi:hypothetical protein